METQQEAARPRYWAGVHAGRENDVTNPINCGTCEHKQNPGGDWCYMFHDKPTEVCMQHTSFLKSHTLEQIKAMLNSVITPEEK